MVGVDHQLHSCTILAHDEILMSKRNNLSIWYLWRPELSDATILRSVLPCVWDSKLTSTYRLFRPSRFSKCNKKRKLCYESMIQAFNIEASSIRYDRHDYLIPSHVLLHRYRARQAPPTRSSERRWATAVACIESALGHAQPRFSASNLYAQPWSRDGRTVLDPGIQIKLPIQYSPNGRSACKN